MSKPKGDEKSQNLLSDETDVERQSAKEQAWNAAVKDLVDSIYLIDRTIEVLRDQLNRAQPMKDGKLTVGFVQNTINRLSRSERGTSVEPAFGRMRQLASGEWRFFRLTSQDRYEHLKDLRVGKRMSSDLLVQAIIADLEALMDKREALTEIMDSWIRTWRGQKKSSVAALVRKMNERAIGYESRVKIDWTKDPEKTLEDLAGQLPQMVRDSLREQVARIKEMSEAMLAIEKRLGLQLKTDPNMQRIAQIPGVGLLTATAAIATMGDARAFKSGREFCAWLGLVPKQTGTGGKVRLGGISKRGDTYVRTLLIHGARSVLAHAKEPGPWLEQIKARRPANVVIVAQAAKMARAIWAVTAKEQSYQRGFQSVRPNASMQAA